MTSKIQKRQDIIRRLRVISSDNLVMRSQKFTSFLEGAAQHWEYEQIAGYFPVRQELNIDWDTLYGPLFLPKIIATGEMVFIKSSINACTVAEFANIPQPPNNAPVLSDAKRTLMFIPALAFNSSKYRLGYGGGYYDRFLSSFPQQKNLMTIGVGYSEQLVDWQHEQHDYPLNMLLLVDSEGNINQLC